MQRREVTFGETELEAADRAIVTQIVAGLRRVAADEYDRHRFVVGVDRLRVVDASGEEVRGEDPGALRAA
jgi:hypothetical protein